MTANPQAATGRPAWKALAAHYEQIGNMHLRELFTQDPGRGERLTQEAAGIYLDYSKHRITDETLRLLVQLAGEAGLRERIDAMFRGDRINVSEQRAWRTRWRSVSPSWTIRSWNGLPPCPLP